MNFRDTIEGDLTPEEIKANHTAQPEDLPHHQFLDDPYYASRDYDLADIEGTRNLYGVNQYSTKLFLPSAMPICCQLGWHYAAPPRQCYRLHRGWLQTEVATLHYGPTRHSFLSARVCGSSAELPYVINMHMQQLL